MSKVKIEDILPRRILILDGAMGTMIQRYRLTEADFRGERFQNFDVALKGNNDLLSLTRPDVIGEIHREYLTAGADIIETNTFNATSISMQDYRMSHLAAEINLAAARLAREAADEFTLKTPDKPRFVAGSIGPTNKTASMSPEVENPMFRSAVFDDFKAAYREQIAALVQGGADLLLIETIFDTLNAKAAIFAAKEVEAETGIITPIILSATLSDRAGRTLSGQTLSAFVASVSHAQPLAVGLNCSLGAAELKPYVRELGQIAPFYISAHPNAGLPNQLGEYDETPQKMSLQIKEFVEEGLVNIIGGCCGTTPAHIAEYARLTETGIPHQKSARPAHLRLSGLEMLEVSPRMNFMNIGERCNVAGSRKFLRLIRQKSYDEALDIARRQVEDGAQVLDINMDDGLLDGAEEMTAFLNLLASDPDVSRVPVMIDSSKWEVLEAGLKCVQGKSIVNSISLKNGEAEFLHRARLAQNYGAAVVVMAFDEKGQADTFERRKEICSRACGLLTAHGFDPGDIIFDPNVLAIATGIDEHRNYAVDFIRATQWIKQNLPFVKVSGGVSNLSFSFRGNDYVREVLHSVFLCHAIRAGMDMGIVNPAQSVIYEEIPADVREPAEDVVLNRRSDATERMMAYAEKRRNEKAPETERGKAGEQWRTLPLAERLSHALVKGITDYLEEDIAEALQAYPRAVDIIDRPLMDGMNRVGDLFGAGKMFLPQVVKAARTMKRAVSVLQPVIEAEKAAATADGARRTAGKILLATVKGDVHDIGKNIVSIVLSCNNYEVVDLGVMVPPEKIIEAVIREKPDIVGLSGLITPSLEEMSVVAAEMEKAGFSLPLLIGGATTSKLHTALKIEPKYSQGPVVYVRDASQSPAAVASLMNPANRDGYIRKIRDEYAALRENSSGKAAGGLISPEEAAAKNAFRIDWNDYEATVPRQPGRVKREHIAIEEIIPWINWKFFFHAWNMPAGFHTIAGTQHTAAARAAWLATYGEDVRGKAPEAAKLYDDAAAMLQKFADEKAGYIHAIFGIYEAYSEGDTVFIDGRPFPFLRRQRRNDRNEYPCLSDFIAPRHTGKRDYIGAFAVTAGAGADEQIRRYEAAGDEYAVLLMKSLLDRLAEAAAEWLHAAVRREYWGYAADENLSIAEMFAVKYRGIRPAVGYPSIPDQTVNFPLHALLVTSEAGISLTENGVMRPGASVSGFFFAHPQSRYFDVGEISEEQLADYARRRNMTPEVIRKFLTANLP
ncbi:MAG: methionine synthase [Proteiniphilum sp.]|jgi:5-methyltetrahydrofolate--homocysteine methyltransferase|nr:methionine synthase [Proteiniphilum sp.]